MADYQYDVLVIGAGPGGYVAAIRAAQLGLKTACAEVAPRWAAPASTWAASSEGPAARQRAVRGSGPWHAAKFGVKTTGVEIDLPVLMGEKATAVKELTGGIEYLFKKNKIDWLKGYAQFKDAHTGGGGTTYTAKHIVIATGSSVTPAGRHGRQ
jgi:dihydrolipoamide dehydrogenase